MERQCVRYGNVVFFMVIFENVVFFMVKIACVRYGCVRYDGLPARPTVDLRKNSMC